MKTRKLVGSLLTLGAIAAAGSAYTEVGMRDGEDLFSGFTSARTRQEVQDELRDANAQGLSGRSRIDGDEQSMLHFKPCRSVADVQSELNLANAQGLSGRSRIDGDEQRIAMLSPSDSSGASGSSGSSASSRMC